MTPPTTTAPANSGLDSLAAQLGVSADALGRLCVEQNGDEWVYPERDDAAEPVGRNRRFPDGSKRAVAGGQRGLCYAPGDTHPMDSYAGATYDDPILIPEGLTDTAAALDLGFCAIGRSTATPSKNELGWLKALVKGRHAVVVGENDGGAGTTGATATADALIRSGASVRVLFPPSGVKDLRDWFASPSGCDRAELNAAIAPLPKHRLENDPIGFAELCDNHPALSPPVVDGLVREGETLNMIAASKAGKSWLTYSLIVAVIEGRDWLNTFPCAAGRVLLVDNELHPATLAHRLPKVAAELGVDPVRLGTNLDVLTLRGKGVDLNDLSKHLDRIEPGDYQLIILDAWYRFIPRGLNENSNADVMGLYNQLDRYAAQTEAAWVVIHHASKGEQGNKAVTDVGSGAGAQSRAADSHVVLRPHEEEDHVVLEAAVRSFPPVEPIGLRWEFPVWKRAEGIDTEALKGKRTRAEERQDERAIKGMDAIKHHLAGGKRLTPRKLREATGFGKSRMDGLLEKMVAGDLIDYDEIKVRGQETREYRLAPE